MRPSDKHSLPVKLANSSQIKAFKGRFIGKQLLGRFTGPREGGQGERQCGGREKERKSVHMQGGRRCRESEGPNVWIRKKGLNFWGEGKASPWARKVRLDGGYASHTL